MARRPSTATMHSRGDIEGPDLTGAYARHGQEVPTSCLRMVQHHQPTGGRTHQHLHRFRWKRTFFQALNAHLEPAESAPRKPNEAFNNFLEPLHAMDTVTKHISSISSHFLFSY